MQSKKILQNRAVSGVIIGSLLTILLSMMVFTNSFKNLHHSFSDTLYTYNNASDQIIIIGVDDKSTQSPPEGLGRYSQWTRNNFTELLKVLETENPKVISLDFIFHTTTETLQHNQIYQFSSSIPPTASSKEKLQLYEDFFKKNKSSLDDPTDNAFGMQLKKFDNVIMAASINGNDGELIKPLYKFSLTTKLGVINTFLDESGILRYSTPFFTIADKTFDDFAVATARQYLGTDKADQLSKIPIDDNDQMMVNYFGDPYSYKMISFVDILYGNYEKGSLKDKILLIGPTSSKEIHDEHYTPRDNTTPMPGVEFRANEIQTILDGKFLTEQSNISQILTLLFILTALTIAFNYLNIIWSTMTAIAAIFLYLGSAHLFYRGGLIINMVYPFIGIVSSYFASWVYKYFIADRKKRELKNAFGHYVSNDLVEEISKNPEMVKLGGERRVVTVFFSDIKDSTAYSEKTSIENWVSQINEYFTVMETVLKKFGGTLDKYEGDAMMGFWNAPIAQADHVLRAYMAAITMKQSLVELHKKWTTQNRPLIEFRIGINTGEALVGNFGSATRFDYTVMGDTVNTASRLESAANKAYGTKLMVANFNGHLSDLDLAKVILREVDTVYLPGKKEPVTLFELLGLTSQLTEEIKNLVNIYAAGLNSYKSKNYAAALAEFTKLPSDSPSQIMADRCSKLAKGEIIAELDDKLVFRIANK
ncbi:MAG: adenylate/guanylate cyclase domain-containing protein [Patescibacteria group bacterium]